MAEITLEMAEKAVKAAQAKARELGTPMTVNAGKRDLAAKVRISFLFWKYV